MNAKINITINSGTSWLLTFIAVNAYAWGHSVPFSEYWVPAAALYGWHSGRRLWRDLKMGPVSMTNEPEEATK